LIAKISLGGNWIWLNCKIGDTTNQWLVYHLVEAILRYDWFRMLIVFVEGKEIPNHRGISSDDQWDTVPRKKTTRSSIANHGRKRTTQSCANQIPRPRTPNILHHIQWYFPINTMGSIYFIIFPFYPMISQCIHRHPKRGVPHLSLGHLDRPGRDFWTGPSWGNLWVKSKHKWWNMISFDTS
jgi:hypothetical protein